MAIRKIQLKSEICLKGHLLNSNLNPDDNQSHNFCTLCGSKVISSCPECKSIISGNTLIQKRVTSGIVSYGILGGGSNLTTSYVTKNVIKNEVIPNYCSHCGSMFPWAELFLENYKLILEMESSEMDSNLKNIIFNTTENLLQDNFSKDSQYISLLKLSLRKLPVITQEILISTIASFGGEYLKKLLIVTS